MFGFRKRAEETLSDFMSRCEEKVTQTISRYEVERWSNSWRRAQYTWAGRMVQHSGADPERLTGKVLEWKGLQSIHEFAKKNKGWQGHPRRFHAWRWEQEVFNFWRKDGFKWKEVARDPQQWRSHQDNYLIWRSLPFSDRGVGRIGRS